MVKATEVKVVVARVHINITVAEVPEPEILILRQRVRAALTDWPTARVDVAIRDVLPPLTGRG